MSNAKPMDALKPYPEYTDSGLPWLEKIPAYWVTRRLDRLFTLRSESPQDDDQRITGYLNGRVTLRTNVAGQKIKGVIKEGGWQRIYPGDFAISGMNAHLGGMGVSDSLGKCSPIYLVLKPHPTTNAHFIAYAVRYMAHSGLLKSLVNTIRFNSADFKRQDLKSFQVWLPSDTEQDAIVRFLDHANRQIDRYIRVKKRMIALLNEQKQAIIHQAVTRGLDTNVSLKPSGTPWLGDIPEHWEIVSVGAATNLLQTGPFGSQLHSHEYVTGGTPMINPSHMKDGHIIPDPTVSVTSLKMKELERHRVCVGDIVAARRGELGRCVLVTSTEEGWLCGTGSLLIRCKLSMFVPAYFQMVFASQGIRDSLSLASVGATMDNLNAGMVARLRVTLPPLEEQLQIIEFVEVEKQRHAMTISTIQRQITLMHEYRTRLIADVVTGQLDVREAAAHLPAVVEDTLLETDDEEIPADDALDFINQEEEYE